MADVKAGLALLGSQLSQEVIDGQTYWFASATRDANDKAVRAYLLPVFDEYTVAYKDRSSVFRRVGLNKLGGLGYAIVVGGQIVGAWKATLKKGTVVIETNLFTRITTMERRAIAAAGQRYGNFLQLPVVVA